MAHFVKINGLNGRNDYWKLASWCNSRGIPLVEYDKGGWCDNLVENVAPHLKFEDSEDALAYVLTNGGELTQSTPLVKRKDL